MAALIKACLLWLALCAAATLGSADAVFSNVFSLSSSATDMHSDVANADDDAHIRHLEQAAPMPRACRWNPFFSSCDINWDRMARETFRTTGAKAAQRWYANSKKCDQSTYQRSKARCLGDDSAFCKWVAGPSPPSCTALIQPFYNHWLACPGSVAKLYYLCSSKFTEANCKKYPGCMWVNRRGAPASCTSGRLFYNPTYKADLESLNKARFFAAWGSCAGSSIAYNQTRCSKTTTRASCTGATNGRFCTWTASYGGVCYLKSPYDRQFLYQNDPTMARLLAACNGKATKALCEAARTSPTSAAAVTANSVGGGR